MSLAEDRVVRRSYFTQDGVKYTYCVYNVTQEPPLSLGVLGDLAANGDTVWFRDRGEWIMASKEVDNIGRPVQNHPYFKSKRRLDGIEWKAHTTWNNILKRKKLDRTNGTPQESSIESHVGKSQTAGSTYEANVYLTVASPKNSWLVDLSNLWSSFPILAISPIQSPGIAILQQLAQDSRMFTRKPTDESILILIEPSRGPIASRGSASPSLHKVVADLVASENPNIWDFVNQYGDPEAKYPEVLASMFHASRGLKWKSTQRLYGALFIESTENGLGVCSLQAHPYISQTSCLVRDNWVSTLTPPGAITHTHMDFYGAMQYFIHIEGQKLWLLWPPTTGNLAYWSDFHKQKPLDDQTLNCIQNLEGLQLLYLDDDDTDTAFILKPNTLHACLSFTQCAHTGVTVLDYNYFDISFSMMEWGLDWMRHISLSSGPYIVFEQEAEGLCEEIGKWEILTKRNRRDQLNSSRQRQLKELKLHLENLTQRVEIASKIR